jgi:hypothetical protein
MCFCCNCVFRQAKDKEFGKVHHEFLRKNTGKIKIGQYAEQQLPFDSRSMNVLKRFDVDFEKHNWTSFAGPFLDFGKILVSNSRFTIPIHLCRHCRSQFLNIYFLFRAQLVTNIEFPSATAPFKQSIFCLALPKCHSSPLSTGLPL